MATATAATQSAEDGAPRRVSHSYSIFMLVLTIFSLIVMVLLILPLNEATLDALRVYDNILCGIFLIDFVVNLARSRPKRAYFVDQRGWLDLIGSIPSLGIFPATGLFRLARLSRLIRASSMLRGNNRRQLLRDILRNRGEYALFITVLAAFMVLSVSTVLVIQFESAADEPNITTGGDALWWAFVTITTVGYGDQFPVTALGRLVAVFVMLAGVGIIGSLASILASVLVPQPEPELPASRTDPALAEELALIRSELAALRQEVSARPPPPA
jgi:voltage-gated potassium channel